MHDLYKKHLAFRAAASDLRAASIFDKADKAEKVMEKLEQVIAQLISELNQLKGTGHGD